MAHRAAFGFQKRFFLCGRCCHMAVTILELMRGLGRFIDLRLSQRTKNRKGLEQCTERSTIDTGTYKGCSYVVAFFIIYKNQVTKRTYRYRY